MRDPYNQPERGWSPEMTKLDISLPDDVKAPADQQVADGRYASLSGIWPT